MGFNPKPKQTSLSPIKGFNVSGSGLSRLVFLPDSIDSLSLILDPFHGVTLNSGNVSAIVDQSGNGNDFTQGTAINQPEFLPSVVNNLPAIRFADNSTFLSSSFQPALNSTLFAVIRSNRTIFMNKLDTVLSAQETAGSFNGPQAYVYNDYTAIPKDDVEGSGNGATFVNYKNGSTADLTVSVGEWISIAVTFSGLTAYSQGSYIGANTSATLFSDIDIAYLSVVDRILRAAEIRQFHEWAKFNFNL